MPIDPSRPPKPSWRDPVKPKDRKPQAQRDWRKEPAAAKPTASRWSRKTRFGLAFVAFLLCGIGLVALIAMFHQPKGAALVLLGAGYENNLAIPHNAYGMKGLNDLDAIAKKGQAPSRWSWSEAGAMRLGHGPQTLGSGVPWTNGWDNINQETIVIFLALHGGTDSKGGAYFLLDDRTGQQRLYVSTVLKDLAKLSAENIVLILDPSQAADNWSLGMLHNDFVRQLKDMDPKLDKDKNLVILLSSNEGQRSWVSEEWRQTIFTHYIVEGLKGGACKGGGPGRIYVKDLFDYVQAEVKQWVQLNRGAVQDPYLIDPKNKASDIVLTAVSAAYTKPDPKDTNQAPGHIFTPPKELADAWSKYQELANRPLPPYVHSPQRWRKYGELLLRYEQLLRAGDTTNASVIGGELVALRRQLDEAEQDLQINLPSMSYSLPLPQTLGVSSTWKEKDLEDQLNLLWKAENKQDAWKNARDWAGNPAAANLLRMQFDRLLLEEAISNPGENLKKAHDLTNVYYDKSDARPAEINYLTVLDSDLDRNRSPARLAVLAQSLRLRRQAEQAALAAQSAGGPKAKASHPYSEWIFSSIKAEVEQGDKQRRLGEELPFSSLDSDWKKAEALLKEAQQHYDLASKQAEALRAALTARDQALAELPAYTRWISHRDDAGREEIEELEKLWADVHSLADDLDAAATGRPGQPDRAWEARAESIHLRLKVQRDAYQQACVKAAEHADQFPLEWRKKEELLSVPALPAGKDGVEVREKLLVNSRSISDGLNTSGPPAGNIPPAPTDTNVARGRAQQQGRLALASLGKKWANQLADANEKSIPPFETLGNTIRNAHNGWQSTLDGAGEQIGDCSQLLSIKIQKNVEEGRKVTADKAQPLLHDADRWARSVDAAGADLLRDNPPDEYRRIRLQGLLLWMADRTVQDYWWDENRSPFYLNAGKAFFSDAKAVALGGTVAPPFTVDEKNRRTATDLATKLGPLLDEVRTLKVETDADKKSGTYWFTDDSLDLKYTLHFPKEFEPGHPVARMSLNASLQLTDAAKAGWHVVPDVPGDGKPVELRYPVQLTVGGGANPKADLELFYRGQRIPTSTPVRVQATADSVLHAYPPDNTAEIAVRVDENAYPISLKIVLDGTLSMGSGAAWNAKTPCKYHDATQALREILESMPDKSRVTVYGFGFTKEDSSVLERLENEFVRDSSDRDQVASLMDRLDLRQPTGKWSPIVDRLVDVKEKFEKDVGPGYKAVLLLTDGEDNVRKDPKEAKELIADAYRSGKIKVNVVLFKVAATELANARKQFAAVKELDPPGTLEEADTSKDLTATLVETMLPKVRFRHPDSGTLVEGTPQQGKYGYSPTFRRKPDLAWFQVPLSKPREYAAVLPDGEEKWFGLKPGERLLVTLTAEKGKVLFERTLLYEYETKDRKVALPGLDRSNEEWQMAVMQNEKYIPPQGDWYLQMMVAVEGLKNRTVGEKDRLQLFRPRFTWLELWNQADDSPEAKPVRIDWGNLSGYPASAWTVEARDWRKIVSKEPKSKPRLKAWVLSDRQPQSVATLRRKPKDDLRQTILVDNDAVTIESVRYEPHDVQLKPGAKPVRKDCVVVRLSHALGKTVMVQLGEPHAKPDGAEHYFYNEASKYTAVFWGVNEETFKDPNFSLELISVDEIKRSVKPADVRLDSPTETHRPPQP